MPSFKFPTKEKLKSKKNIALLFKSGQSLAAFPVLGIFLVDSPIDTDSPLKVGFTVSKKYFKKAVTRNLLKRRLKESWRLRNDDLAKKLHDNNHSAQIMIIFIGKEVMAYKDIDKAMRKFLRKLEKQLF